MSGAKSVRLRVGLSVLALMAGGSWAGLASAETLTDAIAMAYASNPTIQRQRALQRAQDETYVQARSSLGPSLNAGADVGYNDLPDLSGNRSTTSLTLSASQPIFASGALVSTLDAAKADVLAGQEGLRSVEQSVLLNVISVYTAVRRDQEALRIRQENYEVLKRQLDEANARFSVGDNTRTDVAQSEARLAASQASLAQAKAQLDTSRASYIAIVGQAPTNLEPETALPNVPTDFDLALNAAEKYNPDLNSALFAEAAARARVKAARSNLGPTVGLSASYGAFAPTNDFNNLDNRDAASATLRLSIPLFSAGFNTSRIRQAAEGHTAQKMTVEESRRGVIQDTSSSWAQMQAAKSATAANQEQVRATRLAAEGVKMEFQVGLRTNIEVLNAEQEYRSAQLALINAQRDEYVASSQLLAVMGSLNARELVPQAEVYDPAKNFDRVKNKGMTIEPVIRAIDGLGAGVTDGMTEK